MSTLAQSLEIPAPNFPIPIQNVLNLELAVSDPEVISELEKCPTALGRERYALSALRLGVLALRQARGELDAVVVRDAGQKIVLDLESLFRERGGKITDDLTNALRQFFDPASGELPRRLESLLKQDGDLERFLRQHLGPESSTLAKTLDQHLDPLLRLLDPEEGQGLKMRIEAMLHGVLDDQRNRILREFSLDSDESALSRLLRKLTENNGQLTGDVRTLVDELAREFSLDKPDSALSRLVKKVEDAEGLIGKSLTLDDDHSPLSRLKRELQSTINTLVKNNADFQNEVREALTKLQTQRETAAKSTLHGLTFEDCLGELLALEAARLNDVREATGTTWGAISHCKIGDFVTTLGVDTAAAGARIVWEAKANKSYDLAGALKELDQARKNRQAQVGVFVFSKNSAPDGVEPFVRYGNNLVVLWDPEDAVSDLFVKAALSVARALVVRETHESAESEHALNSIELAILLAKNATETAFKKEPLDQFRVFHLAVHGFADRQYPERSALVLGIDPQSVDDGLLQVREIIRLRLNAELTTLSACDTGVGKLQGQEGISNLVEAFLVAGSKSVVASLWSADDTSASALMEHFYKRLAQGESIDSALRNAKLDLLAKYGDQLSPFYWAAFISVGETSTPIGIKQQ